MDKQTLLMASGFIHDAIPYPYGVVRVADQAIKEINKLETENAALKEKLAAHAEVVEAAKGVIESARLWSSQNYPTFDRIELEVTEALAAALAKLEAPNVEDTA